MSNLDMIRKLRSGNQDPVSITINNVRDTKQLCAKFGQQLMLDSTELFSMLSDTILLDSMGFNRENILSLFIPNTYEMYYTISPRKPNTKNFGQIIIVEPKFKKEISPKHKLILLPRL